MVQAFREQVLLQKWQRLCAVPEDKKNIEDGVWWCR
jgi:hypothetical protein